METDEVFKALADPHRRMLLDLLSEEDGRTLAELTTHLPMTRFGVMKHLQILEEAGLLTTQKIGREKHHYLNPVPIQLVYDRWVSKYARPWTRTLTDLKYSLEEPTVTEKHSRVFEIFIRTTPEQLWQALTDGTITPQYYFGARIESTWNADAPYQYNYPNPADGPMVAGQVLEVDPPHRLVTTFQPVWTGADAPLSKVTWQIEPKGEVVKVTVTHDDLDLSRPVDQGLVSGWANILSGLKTLLETGEPLLIPM